MPVCSGPGHAADEYALDFSDAADITHRMRVFMGDTGSWTLGASTYTLRDLRSFQCDRLRRLLELGVLDLRRSQ